ncbi:MAG: hypothetical protein R2835_00765 [Thermomicrobiales bacterium]
MRTFCQGARDAVFRLSALFLVVCLLLVPSAAANGQTGDANVVVSAADFPYALDFEQLQQPVFTGQYIASDPAIIVEDGFLRMFYTCFVVPETGFVPDDVRAGICSATSTDGLSWTEVDTGDEITRGLVLSGIEGSWQENLEASFVIVIEGTYLLYYSGYETEGDPAMGFPAKLAVASSTDGVHFERVSDQPILEPTPNWYDNDAVYSPAITIAGDHLVMVYAGHCYTQCDVGWGVTLLGATSTDGLTWTKLDEPVLQGQALGLDWTKDGVGEPALLYMPDGQWLLFFTSLQDATREIGLAAGPSPFGPWTVLDQPILRPTPGSFDEGGVLAPFVLQDGDMLRMWYLGQTIGEESFAIGYAEAAVPSGI